MPQKLTLVFAAVFLLLAMAPPESAHADLIPSGDGDCYNTVTHVITSGACPSSGGSTAPETPSASALNTPSAAAVNTQSTTMKTQGAFTAIQSASSAAVSDQINADDSTDDGQDDDDANDGTTTSATDVAYCDSSQCYSSKGNVVGSCNSLAGVCYAGYPYADKACDTSSECSNSGLADTNHTYDTGYQSAGLSDEMKKAQSAQMASTFFQVLAIVAAMPAGLDAVSQQMVRPKKIPSLYDYGLSLTSHYGESNFSGSGSGAGGVRDERNIGFTIKGGVSTDDWGVSVSVPVQRSRSDGIYSATNNTSYGFAVTPVYHLLREPLHGLSLNLGTVFGYGYYNYDHLHKLNDPAGPFRLGDYEDDQNIQMGAFFKASQHMRANSVLSLGASYVNHHALQNRGDVGLDNAVTMVNLGYLYKLSNKSRITADMKMVHVSQYALDASSTYGQADIGFTQKLDKDIALRAKVTRSFGHSDWTSTDGMLNLLWTGM